MRQLTLTIDDIRYCEKMLANWKDLVRNIMELNMSEENIYKLIQYEMNTKKRKDVLNRLVGRYFKLLRQREWNKILDYIGK